MKPQARRADSADMAALGAVLGRAFVNDPVWEYFVTPDERMAQRNAKILQSVAEAFLSTGEVYTTAGIEGGSIWGAPGSPRAPVSKILRHIPKMLSAVGPKRLSRLRYLPLTEQHHPSEPHWYLAVLGVEPTLAGRGIGSSLIRPMLERCDRDLMPAYLESSKQENLPLYERHGFVVTHEIDLPDGPRLWTMWRDPDPTRLSD